MLTANLRRRLKRPMGRLFSAGLLSSDEFTSLLASPGLIVTVGDRVAETLHELGRSPDVFIVDGVEMRSTRELPRLPHASSIRAKNPAGSITKEAAAAVRRAVAERRRKPVMVLIEGEEDLLTLPAVAEAPVGSVVFYGQPHKGVVALPVDGDAKQRARRLLSLMSSRPQIS